MMPSDVNTQAWPLLLYTEGIFSSERKSFSGPVKFKHQHDNGSFCKSMNSTGDKQLQN